MAGEKLRSKSGAALLAVQAFENPGRRFMLRIGGDRSTALLQALRVTDIASGNVMVRMSIVRLGGRVADQSARLRCLGLTPSEARLAAAIGGGASLIDAAREIGIAESTARIVLKRVFTKLGISRQAELTGLVTRLAALP